MPTPALESISDFQSGTGTSVTLTWSGSASNQLMIAVFGVEQVASGANNFVSSGSTQTGWKRFTSLGPTGGAGSGIEIWICNQWNTGTTTTFTFGTSRTYAVRGLIYSGTSYDGTNDICYSATTVTKRSTGDNPDTQSPHGHFNEIVVACCAHQLASPGFGTPASLSATAYTTQFDDARAATFGNIEITAADLTEPTNATTITLTGEAEKATWTATASPVGTRWASACFVIRAGIPLSRVYFVVPSGSAGESTSPTESAAMGVNQPLQAHIDWNWGDGVWFNAPDGSVVNGSFQSGPGSFVGGVSSSTVPVAGNGTATAVAVASASVPGVARMRFSTAPQIYGMTAGSNTNTVVTVNGFDALVYFLRRLSQAMLI